MKIYQKFVSKENSMVAFRMLPNRKGVLTATPLVTLQVDHLKGTHKCGGSIAHAHHVGALYTRWSMCTKCAATV